MRMKTTLTIKKRSQPEWLMWVLLVLPMLLGTLNELLRLPWAIRYLVDVAWCMLVVLMLRFSNRVSLRGTEKQFATVLLFLTATLLVYIVQYQSALYYLWGFRNNFRFYAAFFAFAAFMSRKEADSYLNLFDKLFWLNVLVSLVQFFALGKEGDFLGGIFGTEKGGNAYTNIFFLIVITRSILRYLEKSESGASCARKCIAALFVAALAELKFFFVEFLLVMGLAVLLTSFSWRKFWIIFGGTAAVLVGAAFLTMLFPSFAGWFSVRWFVENALSDKGYTSAGDLNRLNAIPAINRLWLKTGWERIFGLGLGNCDTSNFALLNTPFYLKNKDMHYTWLSHGFMHLECGYLGLLFYFGFFGLCYVTAAKEQKRSDANLLHCRMARIMAVCCVLIAVYNSSLRTEAAYMAYFVLALPYLRKDTQHRPGRIRYE